MDELKNLRAEIDRIDHELVRLFEARMNVVLQVAEQKRLQNIPVLNTVREQEVLEKCCSFLENKAFSSSLIEWMKTTMALSRREQEQYLK